MARQRLPDGWSRALAEAQKKYLGNFDTQLRCNCGKGNIIDHASEHDPNARPLLSHEIRFGPQPEAYEELDRFQVFHEYSCDECGATYHRNDVIEGKRGYKPLEAREPISRLPSFFSDKEIEALARKMTGSSDKKRKKKR